MVTEDRTSRAVIRDEALRLFARDGFGSVTIRQIAAAAGVSPALILRHYGSKDGVREATDAHAADRLESILEAIALSADPFAETSRGGLSEAVRTHLPADSPVPAYLARMLIDGGAAGAVLFRRLFALSRSAVTAMAEAGQLDPGADPDVRAAFLLVNDLALLMLRDRVSEVLGADPLSEAGMRRWSGEVLAIYRSGLGKPVRGRGRRG